MAKVTLRETNGVGFAADLTEEDIKRIIEGMGDVNMMMKWVDDNNLAHWLTHGKDGFEDHPECPCSDCSKKKIRR